MASTSTEAPKGDPADKKMSRLDWKKQKELEEARKAGTAPPEVDESGRYNENRLVGNYWFKSLKTRLKS